jgi:hypothetical protein|tara:strand:+ start:98 stop:562 length:465 start_codon:yes stop_codon:yes gene_type:complete
MSRVLFHPPLPDWPHEPLACKLAPGTPSGFKGVSKVREGCYRARAWVAGKGVRTVWTAKTAEEAAWVLARWHICPTLLTSPPKRPAKASDEAGRRVGGEKLAPRVLDAGMLSAAERLGSQPGKRQKCAVDTVAGRADHQMVQVGRIPLSPVKNT